MSLSPPEPSLRPASAADAERVHAWANDPDTRAASFSSAAIPLADHLAWFARQLADPGHHLLIAELGPRAEAVAFVRLDAREGGPGPGGCTISINVAPTARARGLGTATLVAASAYARGLGFERILALIRPHNQGSRRAFEKAGYVARGERLESGSPALVFVHELGA